MTVPTPQAEALMKLVEAYADARHKHGAPEYNALSAAARNAVVAALTTHAGADGWLPIADAPTDGTYLLLWEQYSDNPFVGYWSGKRWSVCHEHVDAEGGWDGANVVDCLSMPITHWRPLPAPPAPEALEVKP